jgi:hypothetical protein
MSGSASFINSTAPPRTSAKSTTMSLRSPGARKIEVIRTGVASKPWSEPMTWNGRPSRKRR